MTVVFNNDESTDNLRGTGKSGPVAAAAQAEDLRVATPRGHAPTRPTTAAASAASILTPPAPAPVRVNHRVDPLVNQDVLEGFLYADGGAESGSEAGADVAAAAVGAGGIPAKDDTLIYRGEMRFQWGLRFVLLLDVDYALVRPLNLRAMCAPTENQPRRFIATLAPMKRRGTDDVGKTRAYYSTPVCVFERAVSHTTKANYQIPRAEVHPVLGCICGVVEQGKRHITAAPTQL